MGFRTAFEISGEIMHPTVDGDRLLISQGFLSGEFELTYAHKVQSTDLPTDVIEATFRCADEEGTVWQVKSRFTSELFVSNMCNICEIDGCRSLGNATEAQRDALGNPVLSDVRYSSDDRFIRSILVDDRIFRCQFKYTTIHFDVSVIQDSDEEIPLLTEIIVLTREGLFTYDEVEQVEPLLFAMSFDHVMRNNTAAFDPEYGVWRDNPIPFALIFERTNDKWLPQSNVRRIPGAI